MFVKSCILIFFSLVLPLNLFAAGHFPPMRVYLLKGTFAEIPWHLDHIHAVSAQEVACGKGVWVVLVDSGVDIDHPALKGHILLDLARNFADEDRPYDVNDQLGHGTAMAGLILQVAPCAKIIPIKINPEGSNSFTNEAFELAMDYALGLKEEYPEIKILNLSLVVDEEDEDIREKMAGLVDAGLLVTAAAGNSAAYHLAFPANLQTTIAVSAIDDMDSTVSFANYGPALTFVAPGVNIYAPYLDGSYATISGTSPATALTSGALALISEEVDNKNGALWALLAGSEDLNTTGHDDTSGFGSIDVERAAKEAKAGEIYLLPEEVIVCPGEDRTIYFSPSDLNVSKVTGPVDIIESGQNFLTLEAIHAGVGYIEFCKQDACRKVMIEVVQNKAALKGENFFYPRYGTQDKGELYGYYALQVIEEQQTEGCWWLSFWCGEGFQTVCLSQWADAVFRPGFDMGFLFPSFPLEKMQPGIYEMGIFFAGAIGPQKRAFFVRY